METSTKSLIEMVRKVTHNKVIPQEDLARATTYCAKLYGATKYEIPQLIREVECEITFELELGKPIK